MQRHYFTDATVFFTYTHTYGNAREFSLLFLGSLGLGKSQLRSIYLGSQNRASKRIGTIDTQRHIGRKIQYAPKATKIHMRQRRVNQYAPIADNTNTRQWRLARADVAHAYFFMAVILLQNSGVVRSITPESFAK